MTLTAETISKLLRFVFPLIVRVRSRGNRSYFGFKLSNFLLVAIVTLSTPLSIPGTKTPTGNERIGILGLCL